MCVQSAVSGEKLGEAERLRVEVLDPMLRVEGVKRQRLALAQRVARNVDALVRGVRARVKEHELKVVPLEAPECRVSSQRILCVFGMIARRVGLAGGEGALDPESESFVSDT